MRQLRSISHLAKYVKLRSNEVNTDCYYRRHLSLRVQDSMRGGHATHHVTENSSSEDFVACPILGQAVQWGSCRSHHLLKVVPGNLLLYQAGLGWNGLRSSVTAL